MKKFGLFFASIFFVLFSVSFAQNEDIEKDIQTQLRNF